MNRRSIYLGFYRTVKYEISLTEVNMTLYFNIYSNRIKKGYIQMLGKEIKVGRLFIDYFAFSFSFLGLQYVLHFDPLVCDDGLLL